MKGFNQFHESTEETNVKLVLLTADKNSTTVGRLSKESTKLGIEVYVVELEGAYIKNDKIHNIDDDMGFEISTKDTVVVARGSITLKDSYLDLLSQFEKKKIMTINSRECSEVCADKYRTSLVMSSFDIPQPKTSMIAVGQDKEINYPEIAVKKLGTEFPVILKTLRGAKGVGVLLVESMRSLDSITQLLYKLDEYSDLLLQEYVESPFDIRAHVLNGEIIGVMRRNVVKGDFRSNYSQGATTEEYKLSDKEKDVVLRAAEAVGGYWVGVDFMPNKGNPLILEVNSSAGTEGIEKTLGSSINKVVAKVISNPDNWNKTKTIIGVREVFDFDTFGKLKAKLDTGNSVDALVIHGENIEYNSKETKVSFTINNKKYTNNLIEMKPIRLNTGGVEKRPIVLLDFTFNDIHYNNVRFTIDDRSEKLTEILVNKHFMVDNNFIIDPSLRYTLGEVDE